MIGSSRARSKGRSTDEAGYRTMYRAESRKAARRLSPSQVRARILACLSLLLVAECCLALYTSPWLYVRNVRLDGVSLLLPEEIAQVSSAAAVEPKTNLLRANTRKVVQDVQSLPFVAGAQVARRPFGTLFVTVAPRTPIAILENGADMWEVDSGGIPIRTARTGLTLPLIRLTSPVPVVPGALLQAEGVLAGVTVQRRFPAGCPAKIDKIDIDSSAELCLNMNDGVVIRFGQQDSIPAKLDLIGKIYREQPDIAALVDTIDIRCPEAPACTLRTARSKTKKKRAHHTDTDRSKRNMPVSDTKTDSEADPRQ